MPYLMIHDIRKEYFDLSLKQYRLTFDDGLFSQYYYFPLFENHPAELIFFITTSFIHPGRARPMFDGEYISHLKTKRYAYRTFVEGRYDHFMTVEEVQAIADRPNVRIGVHSHFHDVILTATHARRRKPLSPWKLARFNNRPEISARDLSIRSKLAFQGYYFKDEVLTRRTEAQWEDDIKYDTELCLGWMADNLGLRPDLYCFPFNEHNEKLIAILKDYGFKKFFAARPGKSTEVLDRIDVDSLIDN
jgi:peptidoglycan/xylan/chitin deacetylase (PgdA/CDA1 family)